MNRQNYIWKADSSSRNNSFLIGNSVRGLIIGKSNCGKTNTLMYLLLEPGILDYNHLIIRAKSLHQPEYKVLCAGIKKGLSKSQIRILFEKQNEVQNEGGLEKCLSEYDGICPHEISGDFSSNLSDIPDPSEINPGRKNLLILDDVMLSPQNNAERYWTRGRHTNIECIYIAQSYFRLPRHTVRENSSLFIIFPQDSKNLTHIYRDLCAIDNIDYHQFQHFCTEVWKEKYNFVAINLNKPRDLGKYSKNFSEYWSPKYDKLISYNV